MPDAAQVERDEAVSSMLAARIEAGDFPSAVYVVAQGGRALFADALGEAVREPARHPATLDTVYDLASLTKPLVTGLLCAMLLERGPLRLDDAVARHLAECSRPDKSRVTLRRLLTHTSGLPAWRPLYLSAGGDRGRVLETIAAEPLEYEPGERVLYSDLGFITLGLLLERVAGVPLDSLARREIFDPLGLTRTFFNPNEAMRTGIAACESAGNAYEREMCRTDFGLDDDDPGPGGGSAPTADDLAPREDDSPRGGGDSAGGGPRHFREQLIWGEVHDGNAYFLGGAAGHAGLFSTARETLALAEQFLPRATRLLAPETCRLFRTNMTEGLNEARSPAWQLAATEGSTAGPRLAPDSFGHLGFTGTSCWVDPARDAVFILLTNRTHARPLPFVNINSVRREFHTLAVAALERTPARP